MTNILTACIKNWYWNTVREKMGNAITASGRLVG